MQLMIFLESAWQQIKKSIGQLPAETGGILLGNRLDFVVQKFVFDPHGSTSPGGYDPHVDFINATLKREWEQNGLALLGFIHSHPRGVTRLSGDWGNNTGDIGYLKAIFKAIPALDKFLVPIVFSNHDHKGLQVFPYVARRGQEENYARVDLRILPDADYSPPPEKTSGLPDPSRLTGAVDLPLMTNAHVVGIGAGGAGGLYENLVRSGLGKLTLIDFDTVDASNLTTQGYHAEEIGSLKVAALEKRLKGINPSLQFQGIAGDFLQMNEKKVARICQDADLLMLMTDQFMAQARGNRVALKFQIPAVFAMMYQNARASEVCFTIPGVTPACFRCAVSSRYRAYLEEGYANDVRSTGSTVFHTHYLNSVIGMVALAILHNQTEGLEFSRWFGDRWDRNFLQVRNHPAYSRDPAELFGRNLGNVPGAFNFDSIWQRIEPEAPPKYHPCPDCGGTGNLLEAAAGIEQTGIQISIIP